MRIHIEYTAICLAELAQTRTCSIPQPVEMQPANRCVDNNIYRTKCDKPIRHINTMHTSLLYASVFSAMKSASSPKLKFALFCITNQDTDATQVPPMWCDDMMLLAGPLDEEPFERILEDNCHWMTIL
jgi:hypothetical protein